MQLDMHYYGTYAMARAAGIRPDYAQAIATAAQYVDDSDTAGLVLGDGTFLACSATAHHPIDARNIEPLDQRNVWIPFHFLPGNKGTSFEERLVCQMDSEIAHEAIKFAIGNATASFGIMLAGIVAHVYADTFSHYGFSGISSDLNSVDNASITPRITSIEVMKYVKEKANEFFEKRKADAADLIQLGHGGVATYPDRPYLRWSFRYADGRSSGERDNPSTFIAACEKLHGLFIKLGDAVPGYAHLGGRVPFIQIRDTVKNVLAREGAMEERITAWQEKAKQGALYPAKAAIPAYDSKRFSSDLAQLAGMPRDKAEGTLVYQFLLAATQYRQFVLRELLPQNGLEIFGL